MKKKFIPSIGIATVTEYIPNADEITKIVNFEEEAEKDISIIKTRGGKRAGAGRKPTNGTALNCQIRVSEKEKEFLNYARTHKVDYDKLMQM